jgi:hypothetical protein
VTELVDRSDRAQDIALTGIFKKTHEADRGTPTCSELGERKGS